MTDLKELTKEISKVYHENKALELVLKGKKTKAETVPGLRNQFFDALTQEVQKQPLAIKAVTIRAESADKAKEEALRRNPRWRWSMTKLLSDDKFKVILEENPELKTSSYTNEELGEVWTRQVDDGSPYVDEVALQETDPDLWLEVSEEVRQLKPLESLDSEQQVKLAEYIYPGNPVVKLAQPRKMDSK